MVKRVIVWAVLATAAGIGPAFAQGPKVEVSGNVGWTFSDGVSGQAVLAQDGNIYDRIDPKDSNSYNFTFGILAEHHYEFGFLYGRQNSTLVVGGTNDREIGDFAISNYHGYFAYNFGEPEAPIRPFVLIGFGATSAGDVDFSTALRSGTISGNTKFSTTWSGGVKFYFSKNFGVKAAARWTPTYVKTDEAGWWCDPFWGCYVIGDAQYANQFELTGGVTVRF